MDALESNGREGRLAAIIVSDYGDVRGGSSRVAILSALALAERGVEVIFFCATPACDELRHDRIRIECVGMTDVWQRSPLAAAAQGIYNVTAARAFESVLARADPRRTIVHFHQWTKALSPSVLRVATKAEFRALVTVHDYLCVCPNGIYFHAGARAPCTATPLSMTCVVQACEKRGYAHKAVRLARQFNIPNIMRRVEDRWGFVHISPMAAEVCRPLLPANARHFVVKDPIVASAEQRVSVHGNPAFLYVGRFEKEKGCDDLAAAGLGFDVIFMGQGPEEGKIRTINPDATVLPWGTDAEVDKAMARCRALVLPSLWYETFGMVVPEALARGIPVIVSDRVGAKALVEDGINGLIYPAGNRAHLRQCLSHLSFDDRAAAMGSAAYARYWAAPLSVEAHAEALVHAYRRMLA